MTTTTDETVITVNRAAADTIRDMHQQAAAIHQAWGTITPEYGTKALLTLSRNLGELFSNFFGTSTTVFKDGELSLYVSTSTGFVYGLIFHASHHDVKAPVVGDIDMSYGAKRTGRYCMATVDGDYCAKPFTWRGQSDDGTGTCAGHPRLPATMPIPGDWSFHS